MTPPFACSRRAGKWGSEQALHWTATADTITHCSLREEDPRGVVTISASCAYTLLKWLNALRRSPSNRMIRALAVAGWPLPHVILILLMGGFGRWWPR